jgi:hypothetical protein
MPLVSIKTGFRSPDGSEETLTQYQCDWPGCANHAEYWLGGIAELGAVAAVCDEHSVPPRPESPAEVQIPVRQPRRRHGRRDV